MEKRKRRGGQNSRQPAESGRPATLVDVAEAAKVSIATASRAINGRRYVSDDTRAQVLRAAEQLKFRPSSLARGFRAQRSQIIGMVVPDISSPFYAAALRGAQHVLSRSGYTVLVCDTEEQPQREREALDVLMGQRVAGVILAPVGPNLADLRELMAVQATALVAIDNRLGGPLVDTVLVDNVGGAAALTGHLIAHGHRRIGHVAGILTETSGADRLIGYRSALQTAGSAFLRRVSRRRRLVGGRRQCAVPSAPRTRRAADRADDFQQPDGRRSPAGVT